jgi:hypothetical protein
MPVPFLEPLGVLVEHRVDNVDEGVVAVEEPVATGEYVGLERGKDNIAALRQRSGIALTARAAFP